MEQFILSATKIEKQVSVLLDKQDKRILGKTISKERILDGGLVTAISVGFAAKYNVDNMEVLDEFIDDINKYNGLELNKIGEKQLKNIEARLGEIINTIVEW